MNKRKISKAPLLMLIVLIGTIFYLTKNPTAVKYNQTQFQTILKEDANTSFKGVTIKPHNKIIEVNGKVVVDDIIVDFQTIYPNTDKNYNYLIEQINSKTTDEIQGVQIVKPSPNSISSMLWSAFLFIVPIFIIMAIISKNGPGKGMEFGKSKAKLQKSDGTTFDHVAGATEEKEELREIVDFLKNPTQYTKVGARVPKGVLLVGPPGTGKTLLAKAVSGEAKVPFYAISGSDFVEMFVGIGASRVRSMFKIAKENAPCIIFIDEIDAVGRHRGSGMGGGHDEREQTLNQLLVEMDGFSKNSGIIIIAATNREDVLDPALLRPGRFDRKITVDYPDVYAREEILDVHAKNKFFSSSISFANIAKRTPGFSGADLENTLNEAALLSVRDDSKKITLEHLDEAIDRVIGGPAKHSKKRNENDRRLVSYHEAGHAIIGLKLSDAEIVQKVTIIPRGAAGGYVLMTPKEESFILTKKQLFHKIVSYIGGRVSEEIHFGKENITTGASDDLKKATSIARKMVTEYGMSEKIGHVQLENSSGPVFVGMGYNKENSKYSGEVGRIIDEEIKSLIDGAFKIAHKIISKHIDVVKLIAESLLKHETLTAEMIEKIDKYGDPFFKEEKPEIKLDNKITTPPTSKEKTEVKVKKITGKQSSLEF